MNFGQVDMFKVLIYGNVEENISLCDLNYVHIKYVFLNKLKYLLLFFIYISGQLTRTLTSLMGQLAWSYNILV